MWRQEKRLPPDRDGLLRYFDFEKLTEERDYYGVHKRRFGRMRISQDRTR
jgi:hypothetical protein